MCKGPVLETEQVSVDKVHGVRGGAVQVGKTGKVLRAWAVLEQSQAVEWGLAGQDYLVF